MKVAPEHTSDATLKVMRKPSFKHFHEFKKKYEAVNKKYNLKQISVYKAFNMLDIRAYES